MDRASSNLGRRNVLFGLAAAAAAAIVAVPLLKPAAGDRARRLMAGNPLTRRFVSLAHAEQAQWTEQVGATFTAEGGYRLRLAGVEPLLSQGARPAGTRANAFAAVFDVLDGMTMAGDMIYMARHAQYGAMPLFLSASASPSRMFAVFN